MDQRVSVITLGVADLSRARNFYAAMGWRPPKERRARIFIDPDGHPWEVAHNPGWALHADGTISLGS